MGQEEGGQWGEARIGRRKIEIRLLLRRNEGWNAAAKVDSARGQRGSKRGVRAAADVGGTAHHFPLSHAHGLVGVLLRTRRWLRKSNSTGIKRQCGENPGDLFMLLLKEREVEAYPVAITMQRPSSSISSALGEMDGGVRSRSGGRRGRSRSSSVQGQGGGRRAPNWMCIAFVDHLRLSFCLVYISMDSLLVCYIVWCVWCEVSKYAIAMRLQNVNG